jgi:hypothetical protein
MSATRDDVVIVEAGRRAWIVVTNEGTRDAGLLFRGRTFLMRVFLDQHEAAAEASLLSNSEVWASTLGGWVKASKSANIPLIVQRRGGDLYFITGVVDMAPSRVTGARGPPV